MGSRIVDMLMLVSRVQDRRGDIRVPLRQDPDVEREVHAYLDDVNWLAQRARITPGSGGIADGKARLLGSLRRQPRRRAWMRRVRLVAGSAAAATICALAFSVHAVGQVMPGSLSDLMSRVLDAEQVNAVPTESDSLDAADSGGDFTH